MKIKRFLAGMLSVFLLVGTLAVGSVSAADTVWGEVDGTPGITASDALYVLQYVVNLIKLDTDQRVSADVSGDGMISASDALLILQYVVHLIDRFPADKEDDTASSDPVSSELTSSEPVSSDPVSSETVSSEPTSSEDEDAGDDDGIQDLPDDPTEELIKASYNPWSKQEGIMYKQLTPSFDAGEIRTTFQNSGRYNTSLDIPSDSTMVYLSTISQAKNNIYSTWSKSENCAQTSLDIMIPGGRDNGVEYYEMYPDRKGLDEHRYSDGKVHNHPASDTTPYMIPTASYAQYKLELVKACCALNPGFIAIEEPDAWWSSCYSEGFKQEWKKYYGTNWQDPKSSAEARYKTSKLMIKLYSDMFTLIGKWMDENYPEVDLVIATHSAPAYVRHGIAVAVNAYTKIPYVDGIIAQVWSDTMRANGTQIFEHGYLGYASFGDSMREGQALYALTDAKADNDTLTWDTYRDLWKKSITAQMLQPSINNFQECVWPDRGFTPAPIDYKASQLNVFQVMSEIGGKTMRLYAGTPGISIGYSDTLSWVKNDGSNWMSSNHADKLLLGQALPLTEVGIPYTVTALDYLQSSKDLSNVKLLILSYDASKPLSETNNVAIANWVKGGGTLLYIGGTDAFDNVPGEWWSNKGQTPYQHLLSQLRLNVTVTKATSNGTVNWTGDSSYGKSIKNLSCSMANFAVTYSGSGITPIMTYGGSTVGFDAAVGKGHVVSIGIPPTFFYNNRDAMRDLVKYAVKYTDVTYKTTDLMTIQRGQYIISEALENGDGATLTGDFMDVFDSQLTLSKSVTLKAGESSLLMDVTRWRTAGVPRLLFTGGSVKGNVVETSTKTKFTINGPSDAYSSTRVLGNGLYPQKITATSNGTAFGDFVALWDNATGSLLIKTNHTPEKPVSYAIEWGTTPVENTKPYERVQETFQINQSNFDMKYILSDNSTASRTIKRCEYDKTLVYCFDLNQTPDLYINLTVAYNYKIEVSSDNKNYQTVFAYEADQPATGVSNRTTFNMRLADYAGEDGEVYVRLGNSMPEQQYGTGLSVMVLNYRKTLS